MRRWLAISLCVVACDCGGQTGSSGSSLPSALDDLSARGEVIPFSGWSVEGVALYRAAWAVPDRSTVRIVGVEGDALLEGPALMRRMGDGLGPADLAERALGVLMDRGMHSPLTPDDERTQFASEQEWTVVEAPRLEERTVVFYTFAGEMNPTLNEHRLDLDTMQVQSRPVSDVLVARGEEVVHGDARCVAIAPCGCWDGCVRAVSVQIPPEGEWAHRVVEGEYDGMLLTQDDSCHEGTCFSVCRADSPTAHCDNYAFVPAELECGEACPPSEAPYHCDTYADRCEQVDHPIRRGETE